MLTEENITQNTKWNFSLVRVSLNLSARDAKSSIYFCEYYSLITSFVNNNVMAKK